MFVDYLLREHKEKLLQILSSPNPSKHHSINITFLQLFEEDHDLATLLLQSPDEALEKCDLHVQRVQTELESEITTIQLESTGTTCLNDPMESIVIHARIYDLPFCTELHRKIFPKTDVTPFLQLSGVVVRISAVKLLEYKRDYVCAKCRETVTITALYEERYQIVAPCRCPKCNGIKMVQEDKLQADYCKDYQEIKIQEDVTILGPGNMPNSMWITLEDDLADICKPGDAIIVSGSLKRRWRTPVEGKPLEVELAMKANHISINNDMTDSTTLTYEMQKRLENFWMHHRDNELIGRDIILRSFCPQIYGMYMVKLAVVVVLAGGSLFSDEDGDETKMRVRTEPHLLLVGDPGIGKSQFLKYAAKVIPRSVMTTGIGSTKAGLTVAAIMEDGEWQLEAGALVLSDGGICCIDEFNSMKESDRMTLHEAMEQQTISVAKANIVCKLNTRCSILAAANPKGPLDTTQPLSFNIAMASPLLSRFDLILLLKDRMDPALDAKIVDFILRGQKHVDDTHSSDIWTMEMLQDYFVRIKKLNPLLTLETRKILSLYYQYQRKLKFRNQARTTVRLLDSLIRLSQAHARLMYHTTVQVVDVMMAIALVDLSMGVDSVAATNCADGLYDTHADFPRDPDELYAAQAKSVFAKLQLDADEFIPTPKTIVTLQSPSADYSIGLGENEIFIHQDEVEAMEIEVENESQVKKNNDDENMKENLLESQLEEDIEVATCDTDGADVSDRLKMLKKKFGFLAHEEKTTNINKSIVTSSIQAGSSTSKFGNKSIFEEDNLDDFDFDL